MAESSGKTTRIAIALVLLLGAGGVWYWTRPGKSPFPSERTFVCVATGKLFAIPNEGKVRIYPLENPDTKQRTLFPCVKHDDGSYYVLSRWREGVRQLGDVNKAVDLQTLRVREARP